MSSRTIFAALTMLAAFSFCQIALAVDSDQLIDPNRVIGQEPAEESPDALQGMFSNDAASSGALITLIGYSVIIGAIAVIVWYLFKRGLIRKPFVKGEGKLKISETRMLGNRQFISVVEYDNQKILIGVGPGKIDYLTTLQSGSSDFPQVDSGVDQSGFGGQA